MAPSKLPQSGHENGDQARARSSRGQLAAIPVLIVLVFFLFVVARERNSQRHAPRHGGGGGIIIQDNLSPSRTPEQTIISDGGITVKGTRSPFISSKSITAIRRDGEIVVYEGDRKVWKGTDIDKMPPRLRERVEK